MGVFKGVWLGLLLATVTAGAHAQSQNQFQGPKVMGLLPGYSCMALNLTVDQKSWDALPPVYAEPSARSVRIGIATATVIVAEPRREEHGFVAVLHMDGRPGWLDAGMIRPWVNKSDPRTTCRPAMMSNGRPGFSYSRPAG